MLIAHANKKIITYVDERTGTIVNIERNNMIKRLYYTAKYWLELKELTVYGGRYMEAAPLIRINYLIHPNLLLAEKYYSSIKELLATNAASKELDKLFLPSMYYEVRMLIVKYDVFHELTRGELEMELHKLNVKTLDILHKIV